MSVTYNKNVGIEGDFVLTANITNYAGAAGSAVEVSIGGMKVSVDGKANVKFYPDGNNTSGMKYRELTMAM